MKIVTDHGWPVASDGTDANAFPAFKNERDYIAQSGRHKTTVAAMDWAAREIERYRAALTLIASFGGKTLIAPSFGPDYDKGHQAGAHAAFESAADIARSALNPQ